MVAAGAFLDKYHVTTKAKSKTRELLIRAFLFLDRPLLPDIPRSIYRVAVGCLRGPKWLWIIAFLFGGYVSITTVFYVGRLLTHNPPERPYLQYVTFWLLGPDAIFWVGFVFWTLFFGWASIRSAGAMLRRWNRGKTWSRLVYLFLAPLLLTLCGSISYIGLFILGNVVIELHPEWTYSLPATVPMIPLGYAGLIVDPYFILALTMLVSAPMLFLCVSLLAITILQWLIALFQWLATHILDAASAPETSPFTYATALLGIVVMTVKLLALGP